jgi:type IX secretion system PorP/SprF family membrane protein
MKSKHIFFVLILLSGQLRAQQYPLFTNFVTNAFGFNPAFAGLEKGGEARIVHRSQWTGIKLAPTTSIGSVHARIKTFPFGVGGYVFKDAAGRLNRNGAVGVLTLHQKLGAATGVSFGAAFGMSKTSLNSEFRSTDPNDVLLTQATKGDSKPEMNIGILVRHNNLFFGASVPQFMEKKLQFSNVPDGVSNSLLIRHYYLSGGYRQNLGKMWVEPAVMYKVFETAPNQLDAAVRFGTGTPLWLGLAWRNKAAGSAMVGIELKNSLSLAYAYDLTTSNLKKGATSSHEITVAYRFLKPKDTDKDGIVDEEDKCPNEPGLAIKDGCPEEKKKDDKEEEEKKQPDRDKDGIPDDEDDCPTVAGVKENGGCPANDRDKDGVTDDKDKCPDMFGLKQFEGCPMADRDGDGLRDDLDKCPDEPGPVSMYGCPSSGADADGDGIPDAEDECPNTNGGDGSKNGCPTPTSEEDETLDLTIQNLYFNTDKWTIRPEAKPHLDKLAKILTKKRDWKVRVQGTADLRGSNDHNLTLSKNRAEGAMYYLMARGVKREQLVVEYFGEVNDGKIDTGKLQNNRRVSLAWIFN